MLTPGTIAAIILIPVGAIIIALALWSIARARKSRDAGEWIILAVASGLVGSLLFFLPLAGLALVGFNPDYMAYKTVRGTVEQIASRQIASGKAMETRYVFDIGGQPYGVDDTRAALVKPGETVTLNCVREFVWGSTNNGYACNWG